MNIDLLVSIVLPTYNGSKFLEQAIRSCLAQSYPHFELIIVDDASTDSTPEIIARFEGSDRRIRSIRHITNLGLPAALNSGFAISQGELLTWISDDNLFHPRAIFVLVNFLKANPQIATVYAGQNFIDEQGHIIGHESAGPPEELPYRNCVGPCFLYRRSVYEKLEGYDVDAALVEDYDFWLRAFELFRFHALAEDLYFYRVHADSLSHRELDRIKTATGRILEKYLHGWNRKDRAFAYLRLARDAAEMDDSKNACSYFGKAIVKNPFSLLGRIPWVTLLALILSKRQFRTLKSVLKIQSQSKQGFFRND